MSEPNDRHPFAQATLEVRRVAAKVVATLTIRNTSPDRPLELLTYGVPVGGTQGTPQFRITSKRGEAKFKGPLIKRSAPKPTDYLTIAPGKGMRWEVDLAEHYDIPPSDPIRVVYGSYHPTLTPPHELYYVSSNVAEC